VKDCDEYNWRYQRICNQQFTNTGGSPMALRDGDKTVEFSCEVRAVTEKAVLVVILKGNKKSLPMWIPKSQIAEGSKIGSDAKVDDSGSIEMSEWIATQKELI
jgi:hypothetical protein